MSITDSCKGTKKGFEIIVPDDAKVTIKFFYSKLLIMIYRIA